MLSQLFIKCNFNERFVQYRYMINFCVVGLFLFALNTRINAQSSQFPVYDNQQISKPANIPQFQSEDFVIDLSRLNQYPNSLLYCNRKTLEKLGNFLLHDPTGWKLWKEQTDNAARILNRWDFDKNGKALHRYIYQVFQLENLSLIYLFTGHKELGQFIRGHVLQIAELPYEFWLHAELRGYNPDYPLGLLETAGLCTTIAMTLSVTSNLFSTSEKHNIETALREKGLQPCMNSLDNRRRNNVAAVISSGAFVAAKYFNDSAAISKSIKLMSSYTHGSIEEDGSYGEGIRYFNYPVGSLLPAVLMMNRNERLKTFSTSALRHTASWLVYPHLFISNPNEKIQPYIVHFGDNGYLAPTKQTVNFLGRNDAYYTSILAMLYQDPLASWLMKKFGTELDFMEKLLQFSLSDGLPEPKSPEQTNLPLLKIFDNGDCFIRSTWADNGIVMGMRSGDGSRLNFVHQSPELNSICMGAYGEYMIVSPGSASYRSLLHYQWDKATRSANTITIDDKNQLFPGSGKLSWNKTDVSGFWMQGKPKADVVYYKEGLLANIIINEAAAAYHVPVKNARRSILFIRDPGYFVMIDKLEAEESMHKYTWRIHLNNRDGLGVISNVSQNHWSFSRPLADLDIYLFSDHKLETNIGLGYMHGADRDYSPGGINEGRIGSSFEIEAFNFEKSKSLTYYSVLYPTRDKTSIPKVQFANNEIIVGNDILTFFEGECILKKEGQIEKYKLW